VRPKRARVGKRTRFRFRVKARGRPVRRALVRFAGKRARTGSRGSARIKVRFRKRGARNVRVSAPGMLPARARVRVR
jgi:hypothetical protein